MLPLVTIKLYNKIPSLQHLIKPMINYHSTPVLNYFEQLFCIITQI